MRLKKREIKLRNYDAVQYRRPLAVCAIHYYGGKGYPVCPRCKNGLEREYMSFCDRCGQRLNWQAFSGTAVDQRKRKALIK